MEIKPCPWCGKTPRLWDEEDPYCPGGPVVIGYYLDCTNCGIKMEGEDKSILIKKWNKRSKRW